MGAPDERDANSAKNFGRWYQGERHRFEALTSVVSRLVERLLQGSKVRYVSVDGRTKTGDSLKEKLRRGNYKDPKNQIDDLSGVRIITFTESDARIAASIIREHFQIHDDRSLDKTSELGIDRTGYRSVHLVCELGSSRTELAEYASYSGLRFEIQIRTALQHAWAEIEHDRSYKFSGVLPQELERRLYLAAGALELIDREFDSIAADIDAYKEHIADATSTGHLDIEIDSKSVAEYLRSKFGENERYTLSESTAPVLIGELKAFGLSTLADLDALVTQEFLQAIGSASDRSNEYGLIRDILMYADVDMYFDAAWRDSWAACDEATVDLLINKYPREKVLKMLEERDIDLQPNPA